MRKVGLREFLFLLLALFESPAFSWTYCQKTWGLLTELHERNFYRSITQAPGDFLGRMATEPLAERNIFSVTELNRSHADLVLWLKESINYVLNGSTLGVPARFSRPIIIHRYKLLLDRLVRGRTNNLMTYREFLRIFEEALHADPRYSSIDYNEVTFHMAQALERGTIILPAFHAEPMASESIVRLLEAGIHIVQLPPPGLKFYFDGNRNPNASQVFATHDIGHLLRSTTNPLPGLLSLQPRAREIELRNLNSESRAFWGRVDALPTVERNKVVTMLFEITHEGGITVPGISEEGRALSLPFDRALLRRLLRNPVTFSQILKSIFSRQGCDRNTLEWLRDNL